LAAITKNERFTFFDSQKGNKKQIEVVVNPFRVSLGQSAGWTQPGILVERFGFGRYAADDEHLILGCALRVTGCVLVMSPLS